jgi:signal transduction histidine kinase/CheY-like chemotaxis protein
MEPEPQQPNPELESRIHQEEVCMLYDNMTFSALAISIASILTFFALYNHVDSTRLLVVWIVIMLFWVALRAWDALQYNRADASSQKKSVWGKRFLIGSTIAGFLWGMLAWLGHSNDSAYQALIVVVIMGVAGGSMATLSYRWQTIAYFLIPILGLLELRLLFENDAFLRTVSFLLLIFILFMLSISRKIHKNTNQNVRLRIEADFRERALIEAKEEAERANLAKSNFLSRMSHDLRTPLNAILGFSQLLKYDPEINSTQRANTLEIIAAGKHLLDLVNQILDLAKIEEGKLHIHLKQIWLDDVLADCHSLIKPMAAEKQIQLNFDSCRGIFVNADRTRLKQILLNLLSNAIKYNHHLGTVSLHCKAISETRVRIEVIDNGEGIPAKLQNRLFQPFNRLEDETQKNEGTGIGLSIAKHLTEIMCGAIGFESTIDNGSTFWIELDGGTSDVVLTKKPLGENEFIPPSLSTIETNALAKILVAEDNITNRKLIASQLNVLGYHFDLASNGKEALALHEKHNYTLILADCNMPVVDGYQLASAVRRSGDNKTPIIALTADAFPESEIKCRNAGMNDRMVKPVTLKRLKATLSKWQRVT